MEPIRHLAASYRGTHLAAAEFKSVVHLWDLRSRTQMNTIETTLDFGGTRLAISPDGEIIAVGAYRRHGIAVYRTIDGVELWRRKDLTKVQHLGFDRKGRDIFCSFEPSECQRLDVVSGETAGAIVGAKEVWESPWDSIELRQLRSQHFALIKDESPIGSIPKASFAALSVAFSPSEVCISEAGGPVRLFELSSGTQLWRYDPPQGVHFLEVSYSSVARRFMGVSWPFENGGAHVLSHFDDEGAAHSVCELGPGKSVYLSAFCMEGAKLVTNTGSVFSTDSGKVEGQLWDKPLGG